MRSQWIPNQEAEKVLAALTAENRLVCEISMATGLRVGDILRLKPENLEKRRFTIHEEKTGKTRTVYLPKELRERAAKLAGKKWIFEGRINGNKHRTRQAVWKDLTRAAERFGLKRNLTPHSMRKIYAVDLYTKCGNIDKVRQALNHSGEAVTMVYALANAIDKKSKNELTKFEKSCKLKNKGGARKRVAAKHRG